MSDEIPRRCRLDLMTEAERVITYAIDVVEELPALVDVAI